MPRRSPIPPLSVVRLISKKRNWLDQTGRVFRIGYYRKNDGLDCVWLVNETGEYEQTADQDSIRRDFSILTLSDEKDLYGRNRPVIQPVDSK
jgi:hypothetical protein